MNKPIYILFLFLGFIVANEPPEWTVIPDKVIDEDCISCTDFPIDLNDYLSDPDFGDILTVEVTEVTGATFTVDENLLLDIGLDSDFNGDINVELTASDGEFTPTTTFVITVNPIPDSAEWTTIPDQVIDEDCSDDNSCTNFPIDLNNYLSDVDGVIPSVAITEVEGATFTVDGNLLLDIDLDSDFNGDINVELTA